MNKFIPISTNGGNLDNDYVFVNIDLIVFFNLTEYNCLRIVMSDGSVITSPNVNDFYNLCEMLDF